MSESTDRRKNIVLNKRTQRWHVEIRLDGTNYFLGEYRSYEIACDCQAAAQGVHPDRIPGLRTHYKALDKATPPVAVPPLPYVHTQAERSIQPATAQALEQLINLATEAIEQDALLTDDELAADLVRQIAAAERHIRELQAVAARANEEVHEACVAAVHLYNELADTLRHMGNDSPAFNASLLARIADQN